MSQRFVYFGIAVALALSIAAAAPAATIDVEQLECIPLEGNSVVRAKIDGAEGGYTGRVYFRRLNNLVEDFYYVQLRPGGGGDWWAALPKSEDHELPETDLEPKPGEPPPDYPWAAWWKAKEASVDRDPNGDLDDEIIRERASEGKKIKRDWMVAQSDEDLQRWLESLENEPAEYYAAVFDSYGKQLVQSKVHVVPVRRDCPFPLTPVEFGQAQNLTVGETAPWQEGEPVFHWLCDGIVTRINNLGIMRADEICRACVVAWADRREFLLPAALAGVGGIITISIPPDPSPTRPGPR